MSRNRPRINGQFAPRLIEMLESAAFQVLSLSAHRVLARIEIEYAKHGGESARKGNENGKLPVTYDDFERYGIHRHSIAAAVRELEALGFIEIAERGRAGNAEYRCPHKFRLTYRHTKHAEPTNEWRRIDTIEAAQARALAARRPPRKNKFPVAENARASVGIRHQKHSAESATTVMVQKPPLLSRSRVGGNEITPTTWLSLLASSRAACTLLIAGAIQKSDQMEAVA